MYLTLPVWIKRIAQKKGQVKCRRANATGIPVAFADTIRPNPAMPCADEF